MERPKGIKARVRRAFLNGYVGRKWRRRAGFALLNAMFLMSAMTLLMVVGMRYTQDTRKGVTSVNYDSQAQNMARSGLLDALNWFRRDADQPVTTFDPVQSSGSDSWDTSAIDPGGSGVGKERLGIVRDILIDAQLGLWGRYEVGKRVEMKRDVKGKLRDYKILNPDGGGVLLPVPIVDAVTDAWEGVEDVSKNSGFNDDGQVWRLYSHGYIYRRGDPTTLATPAPGAYFFDYPNEVLAHAELQTEIRRMRIYDYGAAIVTNQVSTVTLSMDTKVEVVGGSGRGIYYNAGTGTAPTAPIPGLGWSVTGTPSGFSSASSTLALTPFEAFGMPDMGSLASIADVKVTSAAAVPVPWPANALVYVKPTSGMATFSGVGRILDGSGILVVDGDMEILEDATNKSTFNGIIYVNGSLTLRNDCLIKGQVIVREDVNLLAGTLGVLTKTRVEYDTGFIDDARNALSSYRERATAFKVQR